jgi:hypothetical protein
MKITPVAFDSLGTRSMATYIETENLKILIDPGVSLAPMKSGLPPHPIELEREEEHWKRIKELAEMCDILIVTHYHYDHHNPEEPELYRGKITFVKHPHENINKSQLERAAYFLEKIEGAPKELTFCDGKEFRIGQTRIAFSKALPHGNIDRLGYVVEVSIRDGTHKFLHTSDIEGGNLDGQRDFILGEDPETIFFDGPMTYPFQNILPNMIRILRETCVKDFIIDHHYLRRKKWREKLEPALKVACELGKRLISSAGYLGVEEDLLEAKRKDLYKEYPP